MTPLQGLSIENATLIGTWQGENDTLRALFDEKYTLVGTWQGENDTLIGTWQGENDTLSRGTYRTSDIMSTPPPGC